MSSRVPMYALLVLLFAATSACEATNVNGAAPTKLSASAPAPAALAFEPSTLRPEFLFDRPCTPTLPFGTRIIIVVSGSDVSLRSIRFGFTDRFGVNALPRVTAIPGSDPMRTPRSLIPTTLPIPIPGVAPLPSTSPIPIPGQSQFPFFLAFDCGIAPDGVLVVSVDLNGPRGGMTSEIRARIGD
jgi:hypothetical protein